MIAGLLLAAGGSTRFGSQKLLATVDGAAVVRHAASTLAAVADRTFVVVGAEANAVVRALSGLPIVAVHNDKWREGLSTSLRAGVEALPEDAEAVVVALGDQPTISGDVYDVMLSHWRRTRASIAVPVFNGTRGHPVVFSRALFVELTAITGDIGARDVISRDPTRTELVHLDASAPPDVDTADDLARVRGR